MDGGGIRDLRSGFAKEDIAPYSKSVRMKRFRFKRGATDGIASDICKGYLSY